MDTRRASRLAEALAAQLTRNVDGDIDAVVAPAMGGLIIGHEVARALKVDSMFLERVDGEFTLRRGFRLDDGARVVMIEDIVTTGLSSREAIGAIKAHGGNVVGAGCLIDRSGGTADIGVTLASLASINVETFDADHVPEDLTNTPAVKPGSRGLK